MRLLICFFILSVLFSSCGGSSRNSGQENAKSNSKDFSKGKALFLREDCGGCHDENNAIVGPSFRQIAAEYEDSEANISHLANMAIIGVKPEQGIWGSREMPPHPTLKREDAEEIVKYMLSFPADPNKPFLHNTK